MPQYFNDSAIERREDDRYGIHAFAEALATSLLSIGKPVGTTIAVTAPWGRRFSGTFNVLELGLALVFAVEYVARLWSVVERKTPGISPAVERLRFVCRPSALLELFIIVITLMPFLAINVMALRLVRLLRIVRGPCGGQSLPSPQSAMAMCTPSRLPASLLQGWSPSPVSDSSPCRPSWPQRLAKPCVDRSRDIEKAHHHQSLPASTRFNFDLLIICRCRASTCWGGSVRPASSWPTQCRARPSRRVSSQKGSCVGTASWAGGSSPARPQTWRQPKWARVPADLTSWIWKRGSIGRAD